MLSLLLRSHLTLIDFEEILRFCRMLASHIVESRSRNVVRLAFFDEAVVLEKILLLRWVQLRL